MSELISVGSLQLKSWNIKKELLINANNDIFLFIITPADEIYILSWLESNMNIKYECHEIELNK